MNPPSDRIKIIVTPPGEAPYEIRRAWVGLVLPLSKTAKQNPQKRKTWGVLSGPKSLGELLKVLWYRRFQISYGYVVNVDDAIAILAESNPEAADWWRLNTPHLIGKERQLMFDSDFCEPCFDT